MRALLLLIAVLVACAPAARAGDELIADPDLRDAGAGAWWKSDNIHLAAEAGRICADIPAGVREPHGAMIGLGGIRIAKGTTYRLSLRVTSEGGGPMRALVQAGHAPWTPQAALSRLLPDGAGEAGLVFVADTDLEGAQLVFQLGGSAPAWRFCLTRVSLVAGAADRAESGAGEAPSGEAAAERIRINQAGYLPDGPKRATLVTDTAGPVAWRLVAADGSVAAEGESRPRGADASSGLTVHVIDFSTFERPGEGYVLRAGEATSYAFAIGPDLYGPLARDAFSYFYPVRSGVRIDPAIAGDGFGRPAGHAGEPPNQGDRAVTCVDRPTGSRIYGRPWSCGYRLDVRGGWYDAGDFGKYVVNGGIAVSQMMGAYERALHRAADSALLRDGFLRIPEHGNGIPDILDEARVELDFLVSMVVPEGEPLAGMAHHKVHGAGWTTGAILPHLDPQPRVLHRPSTAATLNLAAAAAQGARLFRRFDAAYADRLLETAIRAYRAAEAHPALLAPATDGSFGGGDYDDDDVSDEFYWAAAELFLTTGGTEWYDHMRASPHWDGMVFPPEGISWRFVAGLARLDLATVPSSLPQADLADIRLSVRAAADILLATQAGEAFGLMYHPPGGYGWGSNHSVIENMIVVAAAYDLSGRRVYLQGLRESMDYVLGRNAPGISYVTGYGSHYARRQFSNLFAHAIDPTFPEPPRGALAGGPNSHPADPVAQDALKGCAPQACYIDDPRSFSTNEVAINWNAALGWIAAFLADTP